MDSYDRCTNLQKKYLADIVAIYGRGRELFRKPTYMMTRNLSLRNFLIQRLFLRKRSKLLQTREQLLNLDSYLQYFRVNIPHTEMAASSVYHYSDYAWF
jgi:hypothetical protein